MLIDFFLSVAQQDGHPKPPPLVKFQLASENIKVAIKQATPLLKMVTEERAGITFANDIERAEHLIVDAIANNAHTNQQMLQVLSYVIIYLASGTPEHLTELESGKVAKVGFILHPGRGLSARQALDAAAKHKMVAVVQGVGRMNLFNFERVVEHA